MQFPPTPLMSPYLLALTAGSLAAYTPPAGAGTADGFESVMTGITQTGQRRRSLRQAAGGNGTAAPAAPAAALPRFGFWAVPGTESQLELASTIVPAAFQFYLDYLTPADTPELKSSEVGAVQGWIPEPVQMTTISWGWPLGGPPTPHTYKTTIPKACPKLSQYAILTPTHPAHTDPDHPKYDGGDSGPGAAAGAGPVRHCGGARQGRRDGGACVRAGLCICAWCCSVMGWRVMSLLRRAVVGRSVWRRRGSGC